MTLLALIGSGIAGILAHWYVTFLQGRTSSTFKDYLLLNKAETVRSVLANLAAAATLYQITPELTISACVTAYLAGYTLDSKLNSDANAPRVN
jgi:hypothetical protein